MAVGLSQSRTNNRSAAPGIAERLARKDRLIVIGAVAIAILIAGIYTAMGVGMNMSAVEMTLMAEPFGDRMNMNAGIYWTPTYGLLVGLMWWIMMIAMMTPSAAPTVLLYAALKRFGNDQHRVPTLSGLFLAGYLLIWALFAVIAAFIQWVLGSTGLVSGTMQINSSFLTGVVLVGAGLYQFSSLKNACLKHCRSPAVFLSEHNRPGLIGALRMGAHHGVFCLGCCWALMALLFVGGIMNLYWIAGLAIYVIVEKFTSNGQLFSKITGTLLVLAGAGCLLQLPY